MNIGILSHSKLANISSSSMNSILDALGQEKMYYWGFSCQFLVSMKSNRPNWNRWNYPRSDICTNVSESCFKIDY